MGAGTEAGDGTRGRLVVTDMDTIETSNLSRQLLFRDDDFGACKSVAARAAVRRFRLGYRAEAHA